MVTPGVIIAAVAAWYFLRAPSATPAATNVADVSAEVHTVMAAQAKVPTTVAAFGDLAPSQVQSVGSPRPGQLAALLVVAGQRVSRGQLVAKIVSDPSAEASYRQALYAENLAEGEVKRAQALFALQLATTSQVETAQKALRDAHANLDAQIKLGGGETVSNVLSPFDGAVLALNAAQGDRLAAGAPVAQIGRVDRLRVNLGIEPAERYRVRVGNPVELVVQSGANVNPGLARQPAKLSGSITAIQDIVDPKTQLVSAAVDLGGESVATLVPGMRMSALIKTGEQKGWVVPRQSVLRDDNGSYLYQVRDGSAHRTPVVQQAEQGDEVSVSGPLAAELPVVSLGNYELAEGMKVREAKP